MAYSTINKSTDYFNTKTYTGNGGTQAVTGVGFQPDWVWLKSRSVGDSPILFDVVRGVTKRLMTNSTGAESTEAQEVQSFDSDGFTVGSSDNANRSGATMVGWNWLGANGTASNTDGSISSTVSANTTSGFSIVTFTGNSGTVGHGLGVKPNFIVVKSRQTGGSNNWVATHSALGTNMTDNYIILNLTDAAGTSTNVWGGEPTTTTFTVSSAVAANDNNVAYCFAEKKGYSKFGSYTGNGSTDGTFIYTGFKPAFFMAKRSSAAGDPWVMIDNKRNSFNALSNTLLANSADAENTGTDRADFISNGIKIKTTSNAWNANGSTYIYMAFGQSIVGSNNIPATAR